MKTLYQPQNFAISAHLRKAENSSQIELTIVPTGRMLYLAQAKH